MTADGWRVDFHATCLGCDGRGYVVVPAGAPGNLSRLEDAEVECRDCQGTGHDPGCVGCRDEDGTS